MILHGDFNCLTNFLIKTSIFFKTCKLCHLRLFWFVVHWILMHTTTCFIRHSLKLMLTDIDWGLRSVDFLSFIWVFLKVISFSELTWLAFRPVVIYLKLLSLSLNGLLWFNLCLKIILFRRLGLTWDIYPNSFITLWNFILNLIRLHVWLGTRLMFVREWLIEFFRETIKGLVRQSSFDHLTFEIHFDCLINVLNLGLDGFFNFIDYG